MVWKPDYATLAQVKNFLRIPLSDTADDTEIASAITAASRSIDRATGRQFGQTAAPEARTYEAVWDRHRPTPAWVVIIDDLQDPTGFTLTVGGVAITPANYRLEPVNAVALGGTYTSLAIAMTAEMRPSTAMPDVVATGKWGWTAQPVTVLNACKIQSGRFNSRRDALFGVAGSPSDGSELRLLAKLDPDVQVMLVDYVRTWGAV